jgi:hypothetical protein
VKNPFCSFFNNFFYIYLYIYIYIYIIYILPLKYAILDDHSIEHYNGSAGVSFLLQQCIANAIIGGFRAPLFELSYRLVKTCFNRIFQISSLSFFFLLCFVTFAMNYVLVSFDFSLNKLF